MQLSTSTAARLLAINQRAFDNAGCSRNVQPHRPRYGLALTCALLLCAVALAVFAGAMR